MRTGGADLHLHSCHSDGSSSPARLVQLAASAGLEAVSLTDHDTVAGIEEARETGRLLGVRVLAGVEISGEFLGHEIHLLGYGFDPQNPSLLSVLAASRRERERRAERIVARLNGLGLPLRLEQVVEAAAGAAPGRPHVADALVRAGLAPSIQGAFRRYLNPGCSGFVPRVGLPLEASRKIMAEAGGILVLAHAHLNLTSDKIRRLATEGIDGLETEHPKLKRGQRRELALLAEKMGILATGGSDYHGPPRGTARLGSIRVSREVVDRLERLPRADRFRGSPPGAGTDGGGAA